MKRLGIISIGLLLVFCWGAEAQDGDQKIVVEITKEMNGEKRTFKGEYDSTEEMRADPNYQEFAGEEDHNFWFDSGDSDIVISLDHMKDMQQHVFRFFDDEDDTNSFFFHFDDDSSRVFDFNIADFDSEEFVEKMRDLGIEMGRSFRHLDFNDRSDRVRTMDGKRIRITDVDDEFGKRGRVDKKEALELEDLSIYPSSSGKLRIRFNTPEEGELSINVSDLEGKDVFSRYFGSFSGRYSETIDLSGQQEGNYLLEIIQGKKKVTRKIIIN